jgi:hypothetical protein
MLDDLRRAEQELENNAKFSKEHKKLKRFREATERELSAFNIDYFFRRPSEGGKELSPIYVEIDAAFEIVSPNNVTTQEGKRKYESIDLDFPEPGTKIKYLGFDTEGNMKFTYGQRNTKVVAIPKEVYQSRQFKEFLTQKLKLVNPPTPPAPLPTPQP